MELFRSGSKKTKEEEGHSSGVYDSDARPKPEQQLVRGRGEEGTRSG